MIDIIRRGSKLEYYKDGLLHRDDGPAVVYNNGLGYWYKFGKIHRDGGPAVDWGNGEVSWYRKGVYHREDGPAVEWEGENVWYVNGIKATSERPFLKLLIDFKIYDKKISSLARKYIQDEEERKSLDRLNK